MQAEAVDLPAGRVDLVEQGTHLGRRAVGGEAERQGPGGVVDGPAGESGPDDPEYEFTFGLGVLLDGVEVLIRKTADGSHSGG